MPDIFDQLTVETEKEADIFDTIDVEEPGKIKTGLRHVARSLARGAESLIGLPGDIETGVETLIHKGLEKVFGKTIPTEKELGVKKLIKLPTSEEIKGLTQKVTGEFLEPRTKTEEFSDEVIGDLATLMIPVKGKIPFKRSIYQALGGNLTKLAAESLGVGEKGQAAAKVLSFTLLGGIGRPKLDAHKKTLYDQADALIPKNAMTNVQTLEKNLATLEKNLEKGVTTTSKNTVKNIISEIQSKISYGKMKANELTPIKRDINDLMGDPTILKGPKKLLKKLAQDIDIEIDQYGKSNPEFLKKFREANDIHKGINQTNKIMDFLNNKISFHAKSPLTAILLYMDPTYTATALAGKKGLEFTDKILRNKSIRKFYVNTLKSAAKENTKETLKYAKKLDDQLDEFDKI